jgi:hypothetical protein
MTAALITDPRPEIPASAIPMTNTGDFAPAAPSIKRASLKGQMTPMASTQPI